jgi:hypothetical protein
MLSQCWVFVDTNFIPDTASDFTIIHGMMFGGPVLGFIGGVLGMALRRGRGRR